ncbi:MAG: DUF4177 domain-containing protein [bacterium]|nr:MAG: DUF4177 domain-containing protein [bacterium]
MRVTYKVVETQTVTDEKLEFLINRWVGEGWVLDSVKFAMSEASRRPAMAFLLFIRDDLGSEEGKSDGN